MLTTAELRVLYVLRKHGDQAKLSQISMTMGDQFDQADRQMALANLEGLELISSAKTPPPKGTGGRGALVYWLIDAGKEYVQNMIDAGEMTDPANEPRAGKGKKNAHE